MLLGDTILMYVLAIWFSLTIGPIWLGPVLIVATESVNYLVRRSMERRMTAMKENMNGVLDMIRHGIDTGNVTIREVGYGENDMEDVEDDEDDSHEFRIS